MFTDRRSLLPLFLAPVLLLSGCGQPTPMSDAEVDRIAARTAELLRPTIQESVDRAVKKLAAAPAAPPKAAEVPTLKLPPPIPPATTPPEPPTPPAPETPATPEKADEDPVLAELGTLGKIHLSDFVRLANQNSRIKQAPVAEGLKELIQFRMMAFAAREAGLPASDPELEATIQDRLAEFRYEYLIRDTLAASPAPSEEDLKRFYEENKDKFSTRAQLELSEIVTASEDEARALASSVTKETFAQVAREKSKAPSKARGGQLGKVSKERVTKDAWEALTQAEEGAVLGPFPIPGGLQVVYLRGAFTPAESQPYEEVKGRVAQAAEQARRERVTLQLVEQARKIWKVQVHQSDPEKADGPDDVLVSIGPQRITVQDLETAYTNMDKRRVMQFLGAQGKKLFLDLMANRILLSNLARTNARFMREREPYVEDVERQLLINHYAQNFLYKDIEVTEEQVKARYEAEKATRFKTPPERSLKARHILVRVGQDAPEADVAAAKAKIEAAYARIKAGEDFGAVAKEVSEGPTGPRGGDLGMFGPGQMVPPFDKAVKELKHWQVTPEAVRTRFGFHLIRREPTDEYLPFLQVRQMVEQMITQERQHAAVNDALNKLQAKHPVRTFPENFPTNLGGGDAHAGHDHAGHDHAGHDHAGHDHAGHDHGGHDHAGHDHAGHDHGGSGSGAPDGKKTLTIEGKRPLGKDGKPARFKVQDGKLVLDE